jgi:serine/threonine protein kinase
MNLEQDVEIGDFRIVRRLGAGGMGVVYLARQVPLNRLVALKVLGAALAHPSDILRFRREAQAAARLHHPGIATVYHVGQDSTACYLAMEFIDGMTLRQITDRLAVSRDANIGIETVLHEGTSIDTPPPATRFDDFTQQESGSDGPAEPVRPEAITPAAVQLVQSSSYIRRVCEIVRDAASALQHAHSQNVIHRDIKPQNIMLDRHGHPHIIDFGVAQFFQGFTLTRTGQLVGTPMYMSPEQVSGRVNVDHRSDIYSLGLVLYELLTLRQPILAPTREAVLRGVVTRAMIPVSWKNPGVPRSVENVVHKATAKDPDDRYQHAADFADDLQRSLDGQAVFAEPYRYKFDEREIVAERPWRLTVAAFWFFFVAIFYALVCLPHQIGMSIANPAGRQMFPATPAEYVGVIAGYLSLAAVACCIGFWLLSGRTWARWLGLVVAVISVGLSLRQPVQVIMDSWEHRNFEYLALMSMWLLCRFAVVLGGCFVIFVLLMDQTAKQWFRFSDRVRSEHDELLTGISAADSSSRKSPAGAAKASRP